MDDRSRNFPLLQTYMHNNASDKLIKIGIEGYDFSKADIYCADMIQEKSDLFAQLFLLLSREYNSNQILLNKAKNEGENFFSTA